eukprot:1184720-Prorocentrum_minimum.AAC.1
MLPPYDSPAEPEPGYQTPLAGAGGSVVGGAGGAVCGAHGGERPPFRLGPLPRSLHAHQRRRLLRGALPNGHPLHRGAPRRRGVGALCQTRPHQTHLRPLGNKPTKSCVPRAPFGFKRGARLSE